MCNLLLAHVNCRCFRYTAHSLNTFILSPVLPAESDPGLKRASKNRRHRNRATIISWSQTRRAALIDRREHAPQAACLYTVLFFAPDVLHRDAALMRVLVDKHFVDSWVLAWAPGFTSDIAEEWANYKVCATLTHPMSAMKKPHQWHRKLLGRDEVVVNPCQLPTTMSDIMMHG